MYFYGQPRQNLIITPQIKKLAVHQSSVLGNGFILRRFPDTLFGPGGLVTAAGYANLHLGVYISDSSYFSGV